MPKIESFGRRLKRLKNGIDTRGEIFLHTLKSWLYRKAHVRRMKRALWHNDDGTYHVKDIRLPSLEADYEFLLLDEIFEDSFGSYYYFNDQYDEATVDLCYEVFDEGAYGLVNDSVNVTVQPGDIVIDAGAWIGDFAAYASVRGATTYAFEPTHKTYEYLCRTAQLNGNIIPVNKGLSDENTSTTLFVNTAKNSGANTLMTKTAGDYDASSAVETVRLDDFVRENNIPRVDFIKSDIEGYERYMLEGAQETLARFAPKLALCTYHLSDDPQVMAALIKQANPRYNIVQKRKKLFASVPQK